MTNVYLKNKIYWILIRFHKKKLFSDFLYFYHNFFFVWNSNLNDWFLILLCDTLITRRFLNLEKIFSFSQQVGNSLHSQLKKIWKQIIRNIVHLCEKNILFISGNPVNYSPRYFAEGEKCFWFFTHLFFFYRKIEKYFKKTIYLLIFSKISWEGDG